MSDGRSPDNDRYRFTGLFEVAFVSSIRVDVTFPDRLAQFPGFLPVIRMGDIDKSEFSDLFAGVTEHFNKRVIDIQKVSLGTGNGDADRGGLKHHLKAHFPFAEIRKFHPLGFAFVCNRLIRFSVINLFVRRALTVPGAFSFWNILRHFKPRLIQFIQFCLSKYRSSVRS